MWFLKTFSRQKSIQTKNISTNIMQRRCTTSTQTQLRIFSMIPNFSQQTIPYFPLAFSLESQRCFLIHLWFLRKKFHSWPALLSSTIPFQFYYINSRSTRKKDETYEPFTRRLIVASNVVFPAPLQKWEVLF